MHSSEPTLAKPKVSSFRDYFACCLVLSCFFQSIVDREPVLVIVLKLIFSSSFHSTGSVLRAQHRGRSIQHDYTEYVQNASLTHRATVLELFNLVLGWGPMSDAFWKGKYITNVGI